MILEPGNYAITIEATGYCPLAYPGAIVSEGGWTTLNLELDPVFIDTQPEITDSNPTAIIESPENGIVVRAGESIEFRGNVTDGDAPFAYSWDFGGISQSDQSSPGFVSFPNIGEYTVIFTVTDADGDVARASVAIKVIETIQPKPLEAKIEFPETGGALETGQPIDFNGSVSGGKPPYTYLWNFGTSASESNQEDPTNVIFSTAGEHRVVFSATDANNNADSDSVIIIVTESESETKPLPISPADMQTDVSLTPELRIEFSNQADHFSSHWQISKDPSFSSVVFDHVSTSHLYSLMIPDDVLGQNTQYYWRVGITGKNDTAEQWSDISSFLTTTSAIDESHPNGIPDEQESPTASHQNDVGGAGCFIGAVNSETLFGDCLKPGCEQ